MSYIQIIKLSQIVLNKVAERMRSYEIQDFLQVKEHFKR